MLRVRGAAAGSGEGVTNYLDKGGRLEIFPEASPADI